MHRRTLTLLFLFSLFPLAGQAYGQASLTGGGYLQNFDTLPLIGDGDLSASAAHWTDNSTLAGWYKTFRLDNFDSGAQANAIYIDNTGGLQGAYVTGQQFDADRSLGVFSPISLEDVGPGFEAEAVMEMGVRLRNDTALTVRSLTVSFIEEHWERTVQIGRTLSHNKFSYLVGGSSLSDTGYVPFPALDLISFPRGGPRSINGNLPQNQRSVQATLSGLSLAPGGEIWLKWTALNTLFNGSPDSSFNAIDNLSIQVSTVPEPGSIALVLGLGITALPALRRWRS